MAITCCNGCKPPKRSAECHATCPEYTEQKAKHDAEREERNREKLLAQNLYGQRGDAVRRAKKNNL